MPLRHTEPEYTIEELKALIRNEIEIDKNKVNVDDFIEFIGFNENNFNIKSTNMSSVTSIDIEDKSKKIKDFLNIEELVRFIKENKIDKSSFDNSESQELSGNISLEDVVSGLKHSYDDDMRLLKKG